MQRSAVSPRSVHVVAREDGTRVWTTSESAIVDHPRVEVRWSAAQCVLNGAASGRNES